MAEAVIFFYNTRLNTAIFSNKLTVGCNKYASYAHVLYLIIDQTLTQKQSFFAHFPHAISCQ